MEYVYKFVTAKPWNRLDRAANRDLLDEGTLYVARFDDGGKVVWLPLVQGQGPLTAENGFTSQADVVINARRAGDLLKATPMDRPEDIEPNPVNGRVYVVLSNNSSRKPEQVDAANPRAKNDHGHIVEIAPKDGDHAADRRYLGDPDCRRPARQARGRQVPPGDLGRRLADLPGQRRLRQQGPAVDRHRQRRAGAGIADGLYALRRDGRGAGADAAVLRCTHGRRGLRPDFHAGRPHACSLPSSIRARASGSTFETPSTRWPDFKDGAPPRPAVIVITKKDGGPIGS